MNINDFYLGENEKPLDRIVSDGGFCGIFRKIVCIGDSLSSGEFEGTKEDGTNSYHDMFDYSWGQYMARMAGTTVYNFSRGGMTAKEYMESFGAQNDFFNPELAAPCYIIAMGVNDMYRVSGGGMLLGSIDDVDISCEENCKDTFAGWYGKLIMRYKSISPDARFFLMTMPDGGEDGSVKKAFDDHRELLYKFAEMFDNTYIIDLREYAPKYDGKFKNNFYLAGHMNPQGYVLTAKMVASYIDYIIRKYPGDFRQVGFIGTPYKNHKYDK